EENAIHRRRHTPCAEFRTRSVRTTLEQPKNWLPGADGVGEPIGAQASFRRHTQSVEQRGAERLGRHGVVAYVTAMGIRTAVDHAAANAGAGEQGRITRWPMIAAGSR